MKRIVIVAGLVLAAAAFAGVLRPEGAVAVDPPVAEPDTVTVSGTGTVSSVPDEAQVSVGVESQGQTAQAALAGNARDMRKVIDAVRGAGGKDITTQTVSLSPRMTPEGQADGFTATNIVGATIGLDAAGRLIDAAVGAGANTVYGPSLSSSDAEKLYNDALKDAVADARERAEILAAAADRQVGRVIAMTEGGGAAIPFAEKAAAADAGTPVVSGPQDTTASVSVTFELR